MNGSPTGAATRRAETQQAAKDLDRSVSTMQVSIPENPQYGKPLSLEALLRAKLPQELIELDQWVCYRLEWNEKRGKYDKKPLNPATGNLAQSNNPRTWGTFAQAVARAESGGANGVGFVFSEADPYAGIDLDHCIGETETDPDGAPFEPVEPWALDIVNRLGSYTERSPSGTGLHIIVKATLPPGGRKTAQVEMYDSGRFFTVTGQTLGITNTVEARQNEVEALHAEIFPQKDKTPQSGPQTPPQPVHLDDQQLIEIAKNAKNGAKFSRLWDGNTTAYPSHSDADLALCNTLAFYAGGDAQRVDRLFRASGLMRPKWDEKRYADGRTYGEATAAKAVGDATSFYSPRTYRNGTGPALQHGSNGTGPHTEEETPARSSPALETITGLIKTTGQLTELEQIEKQRTIREGLALAIGEINRATHREVISALVDAGIYTKTEAGAFVRDCVADAKRRRAEEKQANRQARADAQKQAAASSPLPTIEVNNRQLSELEEEAIAAIVKANKRDPARPVLYVRGGTLTRITADEHGNHSTQIVTEAGCKPIVAKCADWIRTDTDTNGMERTQNTFPPSDVARAVVNRGEWKELPALEGIVSVPVFGPDGKVHDTQGYNPATRLYYTGGVTLGDTTPTPGNVAQARGLLLDDLFVDFPFRDDASRAHAVALFLAPYVRPMIAGATPLHLIDAPTPGTGKGLLGDVCAIPALGRELPSTTAGKDDDEWRKRITAALMDGGAFVSIDNITQPLDSGALASVLTQSYWQDRILGVTLTVNLRVRTIWIANGNNVVPSDEIARRCLWIRIDADAEKPWEREGFKHPNLKQWVKENRDQLVTAAITLIRAWVEQGMPGYTGKGKSSYSEWSSVLGGILETVGIKGFLTNESELFAATVNENSVLTEFVKAWKDTYGMKTVTVSGDLFPLASFPDDSQANTLGQYKNLLEELLGAGNEMSRRTKLGKLLDRNRDKVIAGCKVVKEDRAGGSGKRYRLKDVTAPQQGGLPQVTKEWAL